MFRMQICLFLKKWLKFVFILQPLLNKHPGFAFVSWPHPTEAPKPLCEEVVGV